MLTESRLVGETCGSYGLSRGSDIEPIRTANGQLWLYGKLLPSPALRCSGGSQLGRPPVGGDGRGVSRAVSLHHQHTPHVPCCEAAETHTHTHTHNRVFCTQEGRKKVHTSGVYLSLTSLIHTHTLVTTSASKYQAEELKVAVDAVEVVDVVEVDQQHLRRVLSQKRRHLLQGRRHRRAAKRMDEVERPCASAARLDVSHHEYSFGKGRRL